MGGREEFSHGSSDDRTVVVGVVVGVGGGRGTTGIAVITMRESGRSEKKEDSGTYQ